MRTSASPSAPRRSPARSTRSKATEEAGSLDSRAHRLVKLGIAIGAVAEGAVRSNVRKVRSVGITDDEIGQTAMLAISAVGFRARADPVPEDPENGGTRTR